MQVVETTGDTVISDTCSSLTGTPSSGSPMSFSLPNLSAGYYEASLLLQSSATPTTPSRRFSQSTRKKRFRVVSRADTLPRLVQPTKNVEYVIDLESSTSLSEDQDHQHSREGGGGRGGVAVLIPHTIVAKDASILQADNVQVCVRVYTPANTTEGGLALDGSSELSPEVSGQSSSSSDDGSGDSSTDNSVEAKGGHVHIPVPAPESASALGSGSGSCVSVHAASGLLSAGRRGEGVYHYELALQEGGRWLTSEPKVCNA